MNIFDLLFIVLFLTSVVVLMTAAFRRSLRILRRWAICAAVYLGIVIVVSLLSPRRVLHIGDDRCFDDWCIAVEGASRTPAGYSVNLRLSSRAGRVDQRENNGVVYLTDSQGRRWDAEPDAQAVPLSVLLHPGESKTATRSFHVPADARDIGLVYAHEGGFSPGNIIIGDDGSLFHKKTVVPLE